MTKIYHHFLDSGAHSLRNKYVLDQKTKSFAFYKTKEFWDYVDAYAEFLKKYKDGMDYYVNVDVIFNPEMSWKVLKYMEDEHGLNPVPVIHYGEDIKWIEKHLEAGYQMLGIGGLGQEVSVQPYKKWADRVFNVICSTPSRLPCVRCHGFAMTSFELMTRYPWWSVDSASWVKIAAYGGIYLPYERNGKWNLLGRGEGKPNVMAVSADSSAIKDTGRDHFIKMGKKEKKQVIKWLDHIDVPLGASNEDKDKIVEGVTTHYAYRNKANILFFEMFRKAMGPWPRPFNIQVKEMFFPDNVPEGLTETKADVDEYTTIFYSGGIDKNGPEQVLGHDANIMLTYFSNQKKPDKRFSNVLKARKKGIANGRRSKKGRTLPSRSTK